MGIELHATLRDLPPNVEDPLESLQVKVGWTTSTWGKVGSEVHDDDDDDECEGASLLYLYMRHGVEVTDAHPLPLNILRIICCWSAAMPLKSS